MNSRLAAVSYKFWHDTTLLDPSTTVASSLQMISSGAEQTRHSSGTVYCNGSGLIVPPLPSSSTGLPPKTSPVGNGVNTSFVSDGPGVSMKMVGAFVSSVGSGVSGTTGASVSSLGTGVSSTTGVGVFSLGSGVSVVTGVGVPSVGVCVLAADGVSDGASDGKTESMTICACRASFSA